MHYKTKQFIKETGINFGVLAILAAVIYLLSCFVMWDMLVPPGWLIRIVGVMLIGFAAIVAAEEN